MTAYSVTNGLMLIDEQDRTAPAVFYVEDGLYPNELHVPPMSHDHPSIGGATCTVVVADHHLVAALVESSLPRGGTLFRYQWYYFQPHYLCGSTGTMVLQWSRVTWRQLRHEDRCQVWDAYVCSHPALRAAPASTNPHSPTPRARSKAQAITTYKIVRYDPATGRLSSMVKPSVTYTLGKTVHQRAIGNHGGGYYSFADREELWRVFGSGSLFPRLRHACSHVAVLECRVWGTEIVYRSASHGRLPKLSTTYLRPVKVLYWSAVDGEITVVPEVMAS